MVGLEDLAGALTDHHARRHGVSGGDPRHDRAVGDPKPLDSIDPEISVDDGAVVRYVLFERGSVVDEYQSLPEHFGSLPPGDVIALGANPTVVSRLTGAEPAAVRAVART